MWVEELEDAKLSHDNDADPRSACESAQIGIILPLSARGSPLWPALGFVRINRAAEYRKLGLLY
jgi:hypothetical protein